jgi:anti-sigma regulatory factor (Ser/Thr protein kinase)
VNRWLGGAMESTGGAANPEEFRLALTPDRQAGRRARQVLRERFSESLPEQTLIDLVAVVTELVNNSVAHGPGKPITVTLVADDEVIRGEVADQGNPAAAIPEIRDANEKRGHGLEVVDRLTSRWAVHEGSTHVWFEMPVEPERAPGR